MACLNLMIYLRSSESWCSLCKERHMVIGPEIKFRISYISSIETWRTLWARNRAFLRIWSNVQFWSNRSNFIHLKISRLKKFDFCSKGMTFTGSSSQFCLVGRVGSQVITIHCRSIYDLIKH